MQNLGHLVQAEHFQNVLDVVWNRWTAWAALRVFNILCLDFAVHFLRIA